MVLWANHELIVALFTHYAAIGHDVGRVGLNEWCHSCLTLTRRPIPTPTTA